MRSYIVLFFIAVSCITISSDDNYKKDNQIHETLILDQGAHDLLTLTVNNEYSQEVDSAYMMHFDKPPQPSRFQVLLRRVGIPIFLKYVAFYTYMRNLVRWLKDKISGQQSLSADSQSHAHYT